MVSRTMLNPSPFAMFRLLFAEVRHLMSPDSLELWHVFWLTRDITVAISVQHHILAQLFLVSFDPKIPRMGAQRKEAAKRTNVSGPRDPQQVQCSAVLCCAVQYSTTTVVQLRLATRGALGLSCSASSYDRTNLGPADKSVLVAGTRPGPGAQSLRHRPFQSVDTADHVHSLHGDHSV